MLRFVGAILIMTAATIWGIGGAVRLKNRARSLNALVSSLGVIKSEICDRFATLPEIVTLLEKESIQPVTIFYTNVRKGLEKIGDSSFSSIWSKAVEETPELLLRPQEALALSELGFNLGRYNIAEQRGAVLYTLRRMESFAKQAELERDKDAKTRAFLGVAAGIFAVIILI